MAFFNILFGNKKVDCPRCLAKGMVDEEDRKRLKRDLFWGIGKCAYCNGLGKIKFKLIQNLSPDFAYITTNISQAERNLLFNKNIDALKRASIWEQNILLFIKQIEFLYFDAKLTEEKIVEFLLIGVDELTEEIKNENLNYIKRIIYYNKN